MSDKRAGKQKATETEEEPDTEYAAGFGQAGMLGENEKGRKPPDTVKRAKFNSCRRALGGNVVEGIDIVGREAAAGQEAEDGTNKWQYQLQK